MKKKQGLATLSPERRKEIATEGGKSHSVEHLRKIGKNGGIASGKSRRQK